MANEANNPPLSVEEITRLWRNSTLKSRRRFLKKNVRPPLSFFLYKYKSLNNETLPHIADLILESRLYLNTPDQVNDPFDTKGFVHSVGTTIEWKNRIKKLIKYGFPDLSCEQRTQKIDEMMCKPRDELIHIIKKSAERNFQEVGLCSLTTQPKNIVMWSHYANQHSGICFQFERIKDDTDTFIRPVPVHYVDDFPIVNWVLETGLSEVLRHKHKGWEYEQETRIFIPGAGRQYLNFSPAALVGIIFGVRTNDKYIEGIKRIVSQRINKGLPDIKLYRTFMHPTKYKLNVFRLNS